jgi:DNA-binding transcriptional regulator YbjK
VGGRLGDRENGVSDRRRRIVEATLAVIGRGGVDAVTHRAVAAEAGVPLAATTYYFGSKTELVQEALELVIARSTEVVDERTAVDGEIGCDELVERLAAFAEAQLDDREAPLIAQYELMLEAGRREHLRPLAERWSEAYMGGLVELVRASPLPDPERSAELLSALIEGALLDQLSLPSAASRPPLHRPAEGVAGRGIAALVSGEEPVLALLRGAVRPRLTVDLALELLLDAVVADRRGGVQSLGDVPLGEVGEQPGLGGVRGPHSGVAVRLQLASHGRALRPLPVVADLGKRALDVLHVMAVLVGDDVGLGERAALGAELAAELVEEAEVEVDVAVAGTVERAGIGAGDAAGGAGLAGEERQLGL